MLNDVAGDVPIQFLLTVWEYFDFVGRGGRKDEDNFQDRQTFRRVFHAERERAPLEVGLFDLFYTWGAKETHLQLLQFLAKETDSLAKGSQCKHREYQKQQAPLKHELMLV